MARPSSTLRWGVVYGETRATVACLPAQGAYGTQVARLHDAKELMLLERDAVWIIDAPAFEPRSYPRNCRNKEFFTSAPTEIAAEMGVLGTEMERVGMTAAEVIGQAWRLLDAWGLLSTHGEGNPRAFKAIQARLASAATVSIRSGEQVPRSTIATGIDEDTFKALSDARNSVLLASQARGRMSGRVLRTRLAYDRVRRGRDILKSQIPAGAWSVATGLSATALHAMASEMPVMAKVRSIRMGDELAAVGARAQSTAPRWVAGPELIFLLEHGSLDVEETRVAQWGPTLEQALPHAPPDWRPADALSMASAIATEEWLAALCNDISSVPARLVGVWTLSALRAQSWHQALLWASRGAQIRKCNEWSLEIAWRQEDINTNREWMWDERHALLLPGTFAGLAQAGKIA